MDVCVLGSLNADIVVRVAELPRPGETLIGLGLERHPGGKGLNQAIAAAKLGADTAMIGCVGADAAGTFLADALRAACVDTTLVSIDEHTPTGQAHIFVSAAGENMIVVTPGANAAVSAAAAGEVRRIAPRVMLCQFETPRAALDAFLSNADGALRIVNGAPAMPEWLGLFEQADLIVVNETELASYAAKPIAPDDMTGLIAAARGLLTASTQTAIVTLGAAGCLAVWRDRHLVIPGRPARVVDTTGAGDCFCGALAAALARGDELEDALRFASLAASVAVERRGASSGMPALAEVETLRASF